MWNYRVAHAVDTVAFPLHRGRKKLTETDATTGEWCPGRGRCRSLTAHACTCTSLHSNMLLSYLVNVNAIIIYHVLRSRDFHLSRVSSTVNHGLDMLKWASLIG